MSWCCSFMIRPPEDERRKREDGKQVDRVAILKALLAMGRDRLASFGRLLTFKVKKEVELHTQSLEERMRHARNSRLTEQETEDLLRDSNPLVRLELVFNDTISGETLERLKRDPDVTVSTVARRKEMQLV